MADVKETLAQLGKMSDEELAELQENDDRSGVQAAVKKELQRRAAAAAPSEPSTGSFDLIGEDGRRILRWHSHEGCVSMQKRLTVTTGEATKIEPSL